MLPIALLLIRFFTAVAINLVAILTGGEHFLWQSGLDDLPARFIRDNAESIAYPISYFIHLSLKQVFVSESSSVCTKIILY